MSLTSNIESDNSQNGGSDGIFPHFSTAHTQFGLETALAPHSLWPKAHFGPENTSAWCLLWPGNTSARNNFGPIDFSPLHFGPGTKVSKVYFFIFFGLGSLRAKQFLKFVHNLTAF